MARVITRIVVHCSATRADQDFTVDDVWRWHTQPKPKGNGWRRGGYHRVIHRDGEVRQMEDDEWVSNGARGFNANSIHICLIGGVDENGRSKDNFTEAQKEALCRELKRYAEEHPGAAVCGHRDLDPGKDCPSIDVQAFWDLCQNKESRSNDR